MSRYCTVETQFKDENALVAALMETGQWAREQIEVHGELQHLLGFEGDQRAEMAHVIIRRKHVGRASNDIGFVKGDDGNYGAVISEYDRSKYGTKWMASLKGNYAYHKLRREQEGRGRKVSRTRCPQTGRQRIEVTGYR